MRRTIYPVWGLTCGACLAVLMDQVRCLAGVRSVKVDLVTDGASRLVVVGASMPDRQAVQDAVVEAGFFTTRPGLTGTGRVSR